MSPVIVVVVPVPVSVPPGALVKVHVPVGGNPFKKTLPVERTHVGCVIELIVGAVGMTGC